MKCISKWWTLILSGLLVITLVAGCGSKSTEKAAAPGPKVIKMGHCHPPDSQFNLGAVKFAELVAQKTNGQVKIEVFHSNQLGDEPELSEGVRMGTVDMALFATGAVTKFESKFNVFDLPFLFRDYAHADKVLSGEVGKYLSSELEKKDIKVLSFWESGFRHYVNNKRPVKSPDDLKGLKLRVPDWQVLTATTKALGANCVPMPFGEVYLACQQGVVDGQEGPVFAIKSAKMYEVQKYMVLDGHTYTPMLFTINPNVFKSLTPEQQKAVLEASQEAGAYEKKLIRDKEVEELAFLETQGKMIIERHPNNAAWREATKSVYAQFGDKIGKDLIQKVIDTK